MKENIHIGFATICRNQKKTSHIFELVLKPEDNNFDVSEINPGQFICLAPLSPNSTMSRPFSIAMVSNSNNTFSILYKVVGENTKLLCKLKEGNRIKFWGPLGTGFIPPLDIYDEIWLAGGGIGIAPLYFFEKVISEYQEGRIRIFYGNRSKDEIISLDFLSKDNLQIATDDSSFGYRGFITGLLESFAKASFGQKILVITCGPLAMMKKVAEISCQYNFDCRVILETVMACGMGSCLGCSIKTKSGQKRVCVEGPVFDAQEVICP